MDSYFLFDEVKVFLKNLEVEKNYSRHTILNYENDLHQFSVFIKNKCELESVLKTEKKDIRSYLTLLYKKEYKATTIKRKLASISSFFNYLLKKDIIKNNPCENIASPKSEKKIPSWLGIDDMFVFLDSIKTNSWMNARNKAIFELMYSTGIRVSELVLINREDLDNTGYLKVSGKGMRQRILPVGKKALDSVYYYQDLLKVEGEYLQDLGPMFLNRFKKRISDRSIRRILDKLINEAGLFYKTSPHKIRHSFATHMLDNGADIRFIQEFLNHKSLSTTQQYTHVTMERLMEVYDKSHPRN